MGVEDSDIQIRFLKTTAPEPTDSDVKSGTICLD